MTSWLAAIAAGVAMALLQYGTAPGRSVLPAALRAAAVATVVALLLDVQLGPRRAVAPFGALDASASWLRASDTTAWRSAAARLRRAGVDSSFLFGDSVRPASAPPGSPPDLASAVRPAVERALAAGRPLVVITDGELDDPAALASLPPGSRVEVVERPARPDGALSALDAPRAAVGGDSIEVRARLAAGAAGAPAGTVELYVGARRVATATVEALGAYAERAVGFRARVPDGDGETLVRAVFAARDAEPRNDTLTTTLDVSAAAGAVFVSTSPDYDARYALEVLRGALSLPTRGYLRIAPGVWRVEGSLAPVTEAEVRRVARAAPLLILHGDSLVLGSPRQVTAGALALLVPPAPDVAADWYAVGAPPSPVAAALTGIPWDSLPPVAVGPVAARGSWEGLEVRQGRRGERRVAVVGVEGVRRSVLVAAAGLWRWQFRGGASADAYATLWGSLFDWLAAERTDVRAALPADPLVRAGEVVRWRRGGAGDTVVVATLVRRGAPRSADSVTLRFAPGATIAESAPLAAAIYDVRIRGGSVVLAVNPSREWIPRPATVRPGRIGSGPTLADPPRLRSVSWVYALALALLCAEWLARRRLGLR